MARSMLSTPTLSPQKGAPPGCESHVPFMAPWVPVVQCEAVRNPDAPPLNATPGSPREHANTDPSPPRNSICAPPIVGRNAPCKLAMRTTGAVRTMFTAFWGTPCWAAKARTAVCAARSETPTAIHPQASSRSRKTTFGIVRTSRIRARASVSCAGPRAACVNTTLARPSAWLKRLGLAREA